MKNLSTVLSVIALIGVIILSGIVMSKNKNPQALPASTTGAAPVAKIAYVDIDSLEAHYEFLKSRKEEFKARQSQMETELQRSYQQMENDAAEVRKKAQANTLTQPEYESAQKRLIQMQQSLEARKQALTDQLLKDQDTFNKDLKAKLDSFLADYNKDKHYDFILSYAGSGVILYANKQLNITNEVIKGMNAISAKPEDTNKKK